MESAEVGGYDGAAFAPILRKPVPVRRKAVAGMKVNHEMGEGVDERKLMDTEWRLPVGTNFEYETGRDVDEWKPMDDNVERKLEQLTLNPEALSYSPTEVDSPYSPTSTASPTTPILSTTTASPSPQSKWTKHFDEVRHFAGGLLTHPTESTKHHTIMRHSHGLVYYQGAYTNLAITIFSDSPLPSDRSLWLQRKGFSGTTGLRIGASFMGTKSAWIDVTPSVVASAADLPPVDERAWQRDIAKFLRKAPKEVRKHQVRETDVLRIPASAEDGYLRVVLCAGPTGKKVLCASPIFRLASTKASPSSVRGSSLATMPMELGLKVGAVVAKTMAHGAIAPVSSVVQPYRPGFVTTQAAGAAYDATGVKAKFNRANDSYVLGRDGSYRSVNDSRDGLSDATERSIVVGSEDGPRPPFPIRFHGKVIPGTGLSTQAFDMATATLANVPEDILLRNEGIYFGWVSISTEDKLLRKSLRNEWLQAIISFLPAVSHSMKVVQRKEVKVHLLHDFNGISLLNTKFSVILMGYLRPSRSPDNSDPVHREAILNDMFNDKAITQASLSRVDWSAEATLERIKAVISDKSLAERYVDVRKNGQRQLDRVPVHLVGVRTHGARLRDGWVGNGGICVPR